MFLDVGGGTGGHQGTVIPVDLTIFTLAQWALHGKNVAKSRQCTPPPI